MIVPVWLGIAAALGLAVGWWLRTRMAARKVEELEAAWQREQGRSAIELVALRKEQLRVEATADELRRDQQASAVLIDTLRAEIENHTRALKEARQSREAIRQQCAQLTGETESLRSRCLEATAAADRLVERDREVRMLQETMTGLSARLAQAVQDRNTASADRTRIALHLETLERQVRDTAAVARAERERIDASRALQSATIADLRRQLDEAAALKAAAEAAQAAAVPALAAAERRVAELETENRRSAVRFQEQLAGLEARLGSAEALAERLEPLRRQVEDREALILSIARERDDAAAGLVLRERELLAAMEALQARVGGLLQFEPALRRAEAALDQTTRRLADVERERERLETESQRAAAEIETLRAEGRDRDARFRVLLTDRRAAVEAGQDEVARLKSMVEAGRRHESESQDDLKRISGIGPSIERRLREQGVQTFRQIALWTDEDIERISRELGTFRSRVRRDQWVAQARREHERLHGTPVEQ